MTTRRMWILGVLLAFLGMSSARADEIERPWAKGVSKENQRTALEDFQQANALLKEGLFPKAVEKYRAALAHWDHPAIHYNMALALLQLDQKIEVQQHLVKALAYGEGPLDTEKFQHAKSYKNLVEGELARVEIVCTVPNATVTLDGAVLFTAPGKYEGFLKAGAHSILASKTGFLTTEITKKLPPGELTQLNLKVYTAEDLIRTTRKWSNWKPWVVAGAGAAVLVIGGIMTWQSSSAFKDYDNAIADCKGCVPTTDVADMKSRGETLRTVSYISYGLGAATLATGAVLLYVNRSKSYRINPVEREKTVMVTPLLGPGIGGAVITMSF